jgi:hypothetical protein
MPAGLFCIGPGFFAVRHMLNKLKRITILTGHLGSGKTELAINLGLSLMRMGKKAVLVDLDIINPYFRTRLVRKQLEEMGLKVVSPGGDLHFADLPAVSPAVRGVIEDLNLTGVFDVGGDDIGAVVLGQYRDVLVAREFRVLFVVNTCRPLTRSPENIIKYINSIREASGMKVSGLVNNANLGGKTDLETVMRGHEMVSKVAESVNLPISFTAVKRDLAADARHVLRSKADILPVDLFMRPPWNSPAGG